MYERSWALTLLDQALARLQREYESDGKKELFDELRFCLTGEEAELAYAQMAEHLHMSEGAMKVAVHRLRRRYREVLRETIAQTLADQDDVDEELRHLFAVFAP